MRTTEHHFVGDTAAELLASGSDEDPVIEEIKSATASEIRRFIEVATLEDEVERSLANIRAQLTAMSGSQTLLLIDSRALDGACLAQALSHLDLGMKAHAVTRVEQWRQIQQEYPPLGMVLLALSSQNSEGDDGLEQISRLVMEFERPVIVLGDSTELSQVMKVLEVGASGYIPASCNLDVLGEAIALARAGGVFVPARIVTAMRGIIEQPTGQRRPLESMFTDRQISVVDALRRGKANKIIAHELNLRESTVKVHIRNIMKKLKASNRTEAAYKLNEIFPVHTSD